MNWHTQAKTAPEGLVFDEVLCSLLLILQSLHTEVSPKAVVLQTVPEAEKKEHWHLLRHREPGSMLCHLLQLGPSGPGSSQGKH